MLARQSFSTDELWPTRSVPRQRSIRVPCRSRLYRKCEIPGLRSARSFPHLQCLGGNDRSESHVVCSLLTCQALDRPYDPGEERQIVLLGVRIDATHRFFQKVETANNDELALRAAQGYVHPAAIPQKSEGPNSRSAIVSYKRNDHHIRFAALEGIDRTDKIEIGPHWRKSIQ